MKSRLPVHLVAWGTALGLLVTVAFTAECRHDPERGYPLLFAFTKAHRFEGYRGGSKESILIEIDPDHPAGAISPLIYGMAMPTPAHFKALDVSLTRWGGNPNTRYNWEKGNCWNAARDWRFANLNYVGTDPAKARPSGTADLFVQSAHAQGAACLLTIPTLGWVARDHDTRHASVNVPASGGMPTMPGSESIRGYDPTTNRVLVSIRSVPRKGKGRPFSDPPDTGDEVVYQDEWVAHLVHRFGPSVPARITTSTADSASAPKHNGVEFYAMDNEPDLWDYTHTDMHPVAPDYQELLDQFLNYAEAVKAVDPTAQITGPVSWGWTGYFFSPRDRGGDTSAPRADRRAHGNRPFLPWFLSEVARHDRQVGHRTLDLLDVHFYPQGDGIYAGKIDRATNELRLRSTRALWDPDYRDESWIDAPVQLLPRLHRWIDENYPGTRLALTEWNWGAEKTLNGGLATAEVLGILGRERVDMACYWTAPAVGSPAFFAFKLYRNADDQGHGFGDVSLPARSEMPDKVSCYAASDSATGAETLLLINKSEQPQHVNVVRKTDKLEARPGTTAPPNTRTKDRHRRPNRVEIFRYDRDRLQNIVRLPDTSDIIRSSTLESPSILYPLLELPAESLTLLRYDAR